MSLPRVCVEGRSKRICLLPRAGRLALLHLSICLLLPAAVWIWFRLGLRFPPCKFNQLTGLYCLTCGATRASAELLHGHLVRSVLLNPVPILAGLFLVQVTVFEFVCWFRKRDRRFRWGLHWIVAIAAVALLYCLLRNFGFVPKPEFLYP